MQNRTSKKIENEVNLDIKDKKDINLMQQSDLTGDYWNVFVLFLLYILQGIPLGMAGSIPMILQNKNISYKDQAMFSLVFWPYSLKLLWAPIVDAVFFEKMGRRKSWLMPVQYLIGIFMLILSMSIDKILENEVPNVMFLTVVFFLLNFLAATQDVVVDGWALTMLQKRNVGYGSTCNSVGATAGYFLGNVILLAFSSPEFCNQYIRTIPQNQGIITLGGFFFFWGVSFIIMTSMVWIFINEKEAEVNKNDSITGTYLKLFKILKLPPVKQLVLILLTVKIGFAATDSVTGLKLIEAGMKKETLSILAVPLVPLEILLPLAISRFTSGPRPLDLFIKAMPYRLVMGLVFAMLIYWTSTFSSSNIEGFPYYYYAIILFAFALHQVSLYCMYVASMGFFARVSDPTIGGTYMTLLNTMSNLGGAWPDTLMLWMVDPLTSKKCIISTGMQNDCSNPDIIKNCTSAGGSCVTQVDGYYVETVFCVVYGFFWLVWKRHSLIQMQNLKEKAWKLE